MIDQIINAAIVTGRHGTLYCLGPFARRVSFSAQQHRALNLVWALHADKRFARGDSIAVIGAGVAGLTVAAGFIGYGCQVDVYETGLSSMPRQRATEHRMVHPTINFWPEKPLSATTELPFLEWYSGTCSSITTSISD